MKFVAYRSLLAAAVIGLASSANAAISDYLGQGLNLTDAYMQASSDCGGTCDGDIAKQLQAMGYTTNDVLEAVLAGGGDKSFILSSLVLSAVDTGLTIDQIMSSLLQLDSVSALDAVMAMADAAKQNPSIDMSAVVEAALAAGVSGDVLVAGLLAAGVDANTVESLATQAGVSDSDIDAGLSLAAALSNDSATGAGSSTETLTPTNENTTPPVISGV
ncbi:hypothetical protein [Oceanobacter mangrovi]|uniref:hypothetical protein n=1 Tax=Oceanobacter mangrovi TaxID=2862510 RepID=UPI001C8D535A|nr:hypothetical protein [Oceanobacter mangrovi]